MRTLMFKTNKFILILSLFVLLNGKALFGSDSISVTYIANCGFLVEIDSHKIIMDGLFRLGHNHYSTPTETAQKLMVSNREPFNDIELIFVSHTHEDHFDSKMVLECMLNNPSVKIICPQQVNEMLSKNDSAYQIIKSRIIECTPDAFTSEFIRVGEVEINACRLAHPGERHAQVQNMAYLVSINGKSVFHSADIDPLQVDKYTGIKPGDAKIDIGFINEDYAKIEHAGRAKEFINAKYNIAMHLTDSQALLWLDAIKDQPGLYPNPYIFTQKMDRKMYYIDPLE